MISRRIIRFPSILMFTITLLAAFFIRGLLPAIGAPAVTDLSISEAVEDALLLDRHVRSDLIDAVAKDGVVTLSGSVDNLLAKQRAGRIAESVKGVTTVVNTINVLPPILRSDKEIQTDVTRALLVDPATDSYEIDVNVSDNVVTLSGTVDSWQEKVLSGKVAMGVKGVTAVRNDLVFEYQDNRPDEEIRQDILDSLRWDVRVDHALIGVAVNDGRVSLSGTVGSLAEKRQAIADAYVANVTEVDARQLTVDLWARSPQLRGDKYQDVADDEIREAVDTALAFDPRVKAFNVAASVSDGVVTLRGTVDNLKARRAAHQDARDTVGVAWVVNRIKVRPLESISDRQVEKDIEHAFMRDPVVASYELTADVRNGMVDLFGSVGTIYEKQTAADLASRINGVVAVNNYILVKPTAAPYDFDPFAVGPMVGRDYWSRYDARITDHQTDARIKSEIEDELFWSPFVNEDEITVSVEKGKATLTGSVGSWREWQAASDNAYEGGAAVVDNRLQVR